MSSTPQRSVCLHLNIPFTLHAQTFESRALITGWDSARMHAYMQALEQELAANAEQFEDCEVVDIRLGGGTASLAHGDDIVSLMRLIRSRYNISESASLTMRASISNFSGASTPLFKRAGVKRFDLEMLSLDPVAFPRYNKVDALGDFAVVCDYFLRSYTNDNLGLILMWGLDQPNSPCLRRSVNAALNTHAVHISLEPFEGASALAPALMKEQYQQAQELLINAGFVEYTSRHFAKPGFEDPYFVARALKTDVLDFGLKAQTVFDGVSSYNTDDLQRYLTHSNDYTRITVSVESVA